MCGYSLMKCQAWKCGKNASEFIQQTPKEEFPLRDRRVKFKALCQHHAHLAMEDPGRISEILSEDEFMVSAVMNI